jgi:hypothetical protein
MSGKNCQKLEAQHLTTELYSDDTQGNDEGQSNLNLNCKNYASK